MITFDQEAHIVELFLLFLYQDIDYDHYTYLDGIGWDTAPEVWKMAIEYDLALLVLLMEMWMRCGFFEGETHTLPSLSAMQNHYVDCEHDPAPPRPASFKLTSDGCLVPQPPPRRCLSRAGLQSLRGCREPGTRQFG